MQLPKGLYKRGKSYYLDYKDETGMRIRRSTGPDLHRALDLLKAVRGSRTKVHGGTGLKAVLDSYLIRQRIYSKPRSVRVAESSVRRLLLHFGDPPVLELEQSDIDGFVVARRAQGVSEKTVNNDLIVLRAALNHGAAVGLTPEGGSHHEPCLRSDVGCRPLQASDDAGPLAAEHFIHVRIDIARWFFGCERIFDPAQKKSVDQFDRSWFTLDVPESQRSGAGRRPPRGLRIVGWPRFARFGTAR